MGCGSSSGRGKRHAGQPAGNGLERRRGGPDDFSSVVLQDGHCGSSHRMDSSGTRRHRVTKHRKRRSRDRVDGSLSQSDSDLSRSGSSSRGTPSSLSGGRRVLASQRQSPQPLPPSAPNDNANDNASESVASSGTPSDPESTCSDGQDNNMCSANNPYGTFDPDSVGCPLKRSGSLGNQVVTDMPEEPPEDFLFTDFTIDKEEIKVIKARRAENRKRGGPAVRGMKPKSDDANFQFSDFAVSVVSDLEEEIIRSHLQKKKEAGEAFRPQEQAAMFQFGDFTICKTDKVAERKTESRRLKGYEFRALLGHSTRVKTIGLIPNEKSYVSCSNTDTDLGMYDIDTGREIISFVGHESTITGASFSSNSKFIATTSTDYNMILWDIVNGKQVFVFEHVKIVICSCFSTDGKYLVSGSQDKICRVWDTRKGRLVRSHNAHTGIIIAVSYAPNADHVASASSDKCLRIWNATTGLQVHELVGHTGIVLSCQFSFDGLRLVSNDEQVVRVWNAQTGQTMLKLPVTCLSPLTPMPPAWRCTWTLCSFCPGQSLPIGYFIVVASSDRTVRIFQSTTGKEMLYFYCKAAVYCLSSGTHEKMVFGDSYGNVYVVKLQ
eukprot:TRINITY_DN4510_c0_g2_i1.p1 TRINITY_DN4510_c0_g2~~TRINITY_DN4510_c0_g2_i1.p1  ORF type:complete len:606 (+),score=145.21 TRINITY_DN4510_c0_g2_i1:158-1975(+)